LAWLYSWGALVVVQMVLMYIAPVYIMPLFNKFEPLEDGELKSSIQDYAKKEGFALQGIFKMDGSKRSTKSNAYFTGFGKMRRIVLFDTLIEKHSVAELVSVLAHEVGHYKLKHITKMVAVSILSTGLMFYILSLFISQPGLYEAFGVEGTPLYAGFIFFGFLYTPINLILSIFGNIMSRKHEFEADAFAVNTAKEPDSMVAALKKLSVDNLSNLTPHPALVFMEYSHPPVLERIKAIRSI
jgi:STE24 endopeptidase